MHWTILPLINHLIYEALLIANHVSIKCCFSSLTSLTGFDKHVPACRFQSVSPGAGVLLWFSCSQGWKWCLSAQTVAAKARDCRLTAIVHTLAISLTLLVTYQRPCLSTLIHCITPKAPLVTHWMASTFQTGHLGVQEAQLLLGIANRPLVHE